MIHHANWPYECSGVPACVCQQCDNVLNITPSIGVDIDECAENNGGCSDQAVCTNTEGSFACTCNDGFAGDGFTCTGMSSSSLSEYFYGHTRQARLYSIVGQNRFFLPPFSQMSIDQHEICQESVVAWSTLDSLFSSISVHGRLHGKRKRLCLLRILCTGPNCPRPIPRRDPRFRDRG